MYFPSASKNRITFDGLFWGEPIEISDATGYSVTEVSYNTGPYAIVESGSNSSGRWIKFSDGTMIQYGYKYNSVNVDITTSFHEGNYGWFFLDFPTSFVDTNFAISAFARLLDYIPTIQLEGTYSTDRVGFFVMDIGVPLGSYTFKHFCWYAIGRWKE